VSANVELKALDGANPLGFLAALGTMIALNRAGEREAKLHWRVGPTWVPVITRVAVSDPGEFANVVARGLAGRAVTPDAEAERVRASERYAAARKAVKEKASEIRRRKLGRTERRAAEQAELAPLEIEFARARDEWLNALRSAVPRPELALGDRVDCTPEEYRMHAEALLEDTSDGDGIAMLAAFGTDACVAKNGSIEPTPFQFLSGAGHQWFLKTARQLMDEVTPERIYRALFEPWTYADEKLSMRWDPVEDRRYALSATDPSDTPARTVWMANLLAYRALALFPAAPRRGALRAVGWTMVDGEPAFTWPLWEFAASLDTIRSLLALRELVSERIDYASLRGRGVRAVFRSRRIKVGSGMNYVVNFTPARAV
jgi:hypothetical protein